MKATNAKIPVVVVFAPTATGKTALVCRLFGRSSHSFFKGKGQVISADSMQVYRGMNIGTAKPDSILLDDLYHHLIDLRSPKEQFTAAEFVSLADKSCQEIYAKGMIPVMAGGTGFYIRNFLCGLPSTPESDPAIRQRLKDECELYGVDYMYKKLCECDFLSAQKINQNDAYRILRALEVFEITGKPRSDFDVPQMLRDKYDFKIVILQREREDLYNRINMRVDQMFSQGLEQEVKGLLEQGYCKDDPGMQAIGYREFFMDLPDVESIKEKIKHDSRKYAKKQYVFMKGIPQAKIYDISEQEEYTEELLSDLKDFVEQYV